MFNFEFELTKDSLDDFYKSLSEELEKGKKITAKATKEREFIDATTKDEGEAFYVKSMNVYTITVHN